MKFFVSLNVSYLEKSPPPGYIIGYKRITLNAPQEKAIIKFSDWVNDYAPRLSIGNFMILEISIGLPGTNSKLKTNAAKALNNALDLVSEAEKDFMSMEPGGVMFYCRRSVEDLSDFIFKLYKNNSTDDNMQKIIKLSGRNLKYLKNNDKQSKENLNDMKSTDKKEKVKSGHVGIFGFLSYFHHDQAQNQDDTEDHLVLPDRYDAEAALFFTKVFVKFVAELLHKEGKKDK